MNHFVFNFLCIVNLRWLREPLPQTIYRGYKRYPPLYFGMSLQIVMFVIMAKFSQDVTH